MDSNIIYSNLVAMEQEFSSFGHCFEHISSSTFHNFWIQYQYGSSVFA